MRLFTLRPMAEPDNSLTESFKPKKEKRLHRDTGCNNRQVTATFMLAMMILSRTAKKENKSSHK